MKDVKTKFQSTAHGGYVSFGTTGFDTTPDADDDEGYVDLFTVTLDGVYTLDDLKAITKEMEKRIEKQDK